MKRFVRWVFLTLGFKPAYFRDLWIAIRPEDQSVEYGYDIVPYWWSTEEDVRVVDSEVYLAVCRAFREAGFDFKLCKPKDRSRADG